MKKRMSLLLLALFLLTLLPSPPMAAAEGDEAVIDVTAYQYEIVPLISPFYQYLYVKTDNPDPSSFRLRDPDSVYYKDGQYSRAYVACDWDNLYHGYSEYRMDPGSYYVDTTLYPDVEYEDAATWRVAGGYIFKTENAFGDGGVFTLLQKVRDGEEFYTAEYEQTGVRISSQRLLSPEDYVLEYWTDPEKSLFENLDAVQEQLNLRAIYPRFLYDREKPNETTPYPMLSISPYAELDVTPSFRMYQQCPFNTLAASAYPFVLDSLGVPGTIAGAARELDPACTVARDGIHSRINVTKDGETKTYGGAGKGGNTPLYLDHVQTLYTFRGDDRLGTHGNLAEYCDVLTEYQRVAEEDQANASEMVSNDCLRGAVAERGGTWMKLDANGGYTFAYAYLCDGRVCFASDAWINGTYVFATESMGLDERFEWHPTADIIIPNMHYRDIRGIEHEQAVLFSYRSDSDTWSAEQLYTDIYPPDGRPIPEEFLLTREEVNELCETWERPHYPESGLVYDGTEPPGTPFTLRTVKGLYLPGRMTLKMGETRPFPIEVLPKDAFEPGYNCDFADQQYIARLNSEAEQTITAVKPGKAMLTMTTKDGHYTASCEITVESSCVGEHRWDAEKTSLYYPQTCTEPGLMEICCAECGERRLRQIPPDHVWSPWETTEEPTDSRPGTERRSCEGCGLTETRPLELGGHDFGDWTEDQSTLCEENGTERRICANCGAAETRKTIPTGHTWSVEAVITAPTCVKAGQQRVRCVSCGLEQAEEAPKRGHDWSEWKQINAASCSKPEEELRVCADCGAEERRTLETEPHTWGAWTVTKEPLCAEPGQRERTCRVCGAVETGLIPAAGHQFAHWEPQTETCTYTCMTASCAVCGSSASFTIAGKHTWDAWTVIQAPGCLTGGAQSRTCAACGRTECYEIPAAGHQWGEWQILQEVGELEDGLMRHVCTACGAAEEIVIEQYGHCYRTVVTPPTCTEDGFTTHTCERCGDSYVTDEEPALGHIWGRPEYTWSEDNTEVTACRPCYRNADHSVTETVRTKVRLTIAATGAQEGRIEYLAEFENPEFETLRKYVSTPKLDASDPCAGGHDWSEPSYVWAEDYSMVTATRVCRNNAAHYETETARADSWVSKEATLTEEGEISYVAFFDNYAAFDVQEKTVVTPKLGEDQLIAGFDDVPPGKYYAEPVLWAVENGITAGTGEHKFSPNNTCTRAQVVTFLWRAAGQPEPARTDNPFTDVPQSAYYYKAVLWAVENGVTAGTGKTTFSPNAGCTRAQVMTFFWRASGQPEPVSGDNPFSDVPQSAYYHKAVLWAVSCEITKGVAPDKFAPGNICTRAQIVSFLYRFMAE